MTLPGEPRSDTACRQCGTPMPSIGTAIPICGVECLATWAEESGWTNSTLKPQLMRVKIEIPVLQLAQAVLLALAAWAGVFGLLVISFVVLLSL